MSSSSTKELLIACNGLLKPDLLIKPVEQEKKMKRIDTLTMLKVIKMNVTARIFLFLLLVGVFSSCEKEEPENFIEFEKSQLAFSPDNNELTVTLELAVASENNEPLTIKMEPVGVTYGTEFTTNPEELYNTLFLTVPIGKKELTFKVIKNEFAQISSEKAIRFSVATTSESLRIGQTSSVEVRFQ